MSEENKATGINPATPDFFAKLRAMTPEERKAYIANVEWPIKEADAFSYFFPYSDFKKNPDNELLLTTPLPRKKIESFFEASKLLGWNDAYCILKASLSDETILDIAVGMNGYIVTNLPEASDSVGRASRISLNPEAIQQAIHQLQRAAQDFPDHPVGMKPIQRDINLLSQLLEPSFIEAIIATRRNPAMRVTDPTKTTKEDTNTTKVIYRTERIDSSPLPTEEQIRRVKFMLDIEYLLQQLDSIPPVKKEITDRFERLKDEAFEERTETSVTRNTLSSISVSINDLDNEPTPLSTVRFLKQFATGSSILKYATHQYDEGAVFQYDAWISNCAKEFRKLTRSHPGIPKATIAKISVFLLDKELPNGWGYDHYKFGWSHPDLKKWCAAHPGVYPSGMSIAAYLPTEKAGDIPDFGKLCTLFSHEIRFRGSEGPYLTRFLRKKVREFGLSHSHEVQIDPVLQRFDFYTDIDKFSAGLKKIILPIIARPNYRQVRFSGCEYEESIEITLHHIDSPMTRKSTDPKVSPTTISGDFLDAYKNLKGQCYWSMTASFLDGKKSIHYLRPESFPEMEEAPDFEGGVLHTFTFLKG